VDSPADSLPVGVRRSHAANRCETDNDVDEKVRHDVARDNVDALSLPLLLQLLAPT